MGLSQGLVRFSVGLDNDISASLKSILDICREEGVIG